MDLFKRTLGPVQKVMKDADLTISEVDEIVLVGGSTRIPKASNTSGIYCTGTVHKTCCGSTLQYEGTYSSFGVMEILVGRG